MNFFTIIILIFWILCAFADYAVFAYVWQLKEYRLDKFKDYLSTKRGQKFIKGYRIFWRAIGIVALYTFLKDVLPKIEILIFGILVLDLLVNVYFQAKHLIRRPIITKKILLLGALSFSVEALVLLLTRSITLLLFFIVFRFLFFSTFVVLIGYPTQWIKFLYIYLARKKMEKFPEVRVIGVTGSYGKTSVKTFLGQILQKDFKVVTTPKNINTEIGVAQFILQTDFKKYDVFVVEMGAYKMGEIKLICDMVKPTIGILTAINEQHLSLFGSIQNTQKAKYELLRAIPESGLAITNSDNKYCREFLGELNAKVETFGCENEFKPSFSLNKISKNSEGIYFNGEYKNESYSVSAPIIGEHNALNIAPCIMAAHFLGMKKENIIQQCESLKLPSRSLQIFEYGKAIIIDDSYNSNPTGFKAALHYLSSYPTTKKRIVITRGMLELGEQSDRLHRRIGEEISFVVDELVIITKDFEKPIREGIHEKYRTNILTKYNPKELLLYIKELKDQEVVVLLENRIPSIVYKEVSKNN